ncbi:MAG: phosphoglucosamine mutase [Lautropia sp.]|nr:phosphoglucosamine mutase [Lautropia sp.]
MARRYFGTDGVRGRVGDSPITPEFVMHLGYAAGKVLAKGGRGRPAVLLGKDTRISGYMLESALMAGFCAAGVDIHVTGPLPTPAIAYLTRALRLSAGVVLSASHNPFEDNGIKFFSADGNKLPDEIEEAIEALLGEPIVCVASERLGKAFRVEAAAGRYIEFCKSTFPFALDLKGLKLVVDCANGAAYHTAPHVFHELGAEVVSIGTAPNGVNINDGVGAVYPAAMAAAVQKAGADLGISLDGDADRLIMSDAAGRSYDGDELLYVLINDRLREGQVSGVAGTLMTNYAFEQAMARCGVPFERAKVGDRYVLELLQQRGWMFGGENSGHLLALDCHSTGDGTISALQILAAVVRSGKTLAELTSELTLLPQKMINVRVERGFDWQSHQGLAAASASAERELGRSGRILIRPSGTEPVLRVMVEAGTAEQASRLAQSIADSLQ